MPASPFRASLRPALAAAAAVTAFAAAPSASAANIDAFYVGNSLTQDTLQDNDFARVSLPNLASENGDTATVGRHVLFNQSLQYIYDNPEEIDSNDFGVIVPRDFGNYDVALPDNSWDAVVLQPYYDSGIAAPTASTLGTDLARIQDFITLTKSTGRNADTRFYVLETWPDGFGANYASFYEETFDDSLTRPKTTDSLDTPTARSRPYFDLLAERLAADPNLPQITSIPVGEVLFDLIQLAEAGELGEDGAKYTAASFYRDGTHLSAETGGRHQPERHLHRHRSLRRRPDQLRGALRGAAGGQVDRRARRRIGRPGRPVGRPEDPPRHRQQRRRGHPRARERHRPAGRRPRPAPPPPRRRVRPAARCRFLVLFLCRDRAFQPGRGFALRRNPRTVTKLTPKPGRSADFLA